MAIRYYVKEIQKKLNEKNKAFSIIPGYVIIFVLKYYFKNFKSDRAREFKINRNIKLVKSWKKQRS